MALNVLVVGAGPVGLTLAHELTRRGVGVRLIDRLVEPSGYSRALVVHCRTQELLEEAGLRSQIAEVAIEVRGMAIRRGGFRIATIPFDLGRYPALALPQQLTESVLGRMVSARGIEIERGMELTAITQADRGVEATVNGNLVRADYVVGCDGAHSTVRHLASIAFEGQSLEETLWMADAKVAWDLPPDHAWQLLHPAGPLSAIPMPGDRWRLVAMRLVDEGEPTPEFFADAIALRTGKTVPLDVFWTSSFRVNCRLAASYGLGRVLLAGDAAHIHSPIGGQGMNIGIQDAMSLAAKLAAGPSDSPAVLLQRYQAERRPVARAVIQSNSRVTRLAMSRGRLQRVARDHLLPRVLAFAPAARRAGLEASGLLAMARPADSR